MPQEKKKVAPILINIEIILVYWTYSPATPNERKNNTNNITLK
jgi:hypothetical protein